MEEVIPQGSVLSCTLFALAINDIPSCLPIGVKNSLYVDDFAIYYSSSSVRHATRILQEAINAVSNWSRAVGFRFFTEKTKAVTFYRDSRWLKGQIPSLSLYQTPIEFCRNFKFLGLIFDSHMNWKAHLQYIKTKCIKALNLLKVLTHTNWGATRKIMIMLYKATILSIIDYASPIYSSASPSALKTLDPIQNTGIRLYRSL